MKNHNSGGRQLLAGVGQCQVEQCSCGKIHLQLGDISLRLTPDATETLTTVLVEAGLKVREQKRKAQEAKQPSLQLVHGGIGKRAGQEVH